MAAPDCVFHRTLIRSRPGPQQASSSCPAVCRESLLVLDLQRYSRDQGSSVYFPQAVLQGDDLYDVTLGDGDCRLRVTLDPGLNRLVERCVLRRGAELRNAAFAAAMTAPLPACPGAAGDSYRLLSVEVRAEDQDQDQDQDPDQDQDQDPEQDSLPWFGSSEPAAPLLPLRANRSVFLPLWNNVDYSGAAWREAPPTEDSEDEDEDEDDEARRPAVSVSELRDAFLSGRRGVTRGAVEHQLIVRIINKSHLMYYGKSDRNCECPYKAVLEVCDPTGSVCVVLWNSVCVSWYRCLKPGDIISLRRYRVKRQYQMEPEDIEISVNSRNPAARIAVLTQASVSPEHLPPAPSYCFYSSQELQTRPHGVLCDVIGLLTFSGRPERLRSRDGRGAELLEYRWLRLEDGTSSRPIMVKLFATSQPETHRRLHPLCVVVCCRLKLIRCSGDSDGFYLTNSTFTQVYCTGLGQHCEMSYRRVKPVRRFLRWLRSQDDGQVLSRALIGGFFMYPPPPVSLETYMKDRRGEPGFLRGAELQRELATLCYRERRTFCIQAAVTMVTYSRRGEEDHSLFWTLQAPSPSSPLSSPLSSPVSPLSPRRSHPSPSLSSSPSLPPLSSTPRSCRPPLSSSSSMSPLSGRSRKLKRKPLLQANTPNKRRPLVTVQPEHNNNNNNNDNNNNNNTVILFEASMEFLENTNTDEEEEEEETLSFVTAPLLPSFPSVAAETLPMRYDHDRREEQAGAVALGGAAPGPGTFESAVEDYYTVTLRALSDGLTLHAVFLPHAAPPLPHANTWTSILSHGAFSSHTPPPSPGDLISTASQLANQRLVCVLEACPLGGTSCELVLVRAFVLIG